jgi:Protein of unknown function (DUF3277)
MALWTFDPKQLSVIVGPYIIKGFSETMISIARATDAFSMIVGADGEATRVKSNDNSATITITLQQGSPSNDDLSKIATADRLSSLGVFPLLIKDNFGNTIMTAPTAFISKVPDITFAKTHQDRAWVIMTDNIEIFLGGQTQSGANYAP